MREALEMALDALEIYGAQAPAVRQTIIAIKEALAQDELCSPQEPVAVYGYCPECGAKGLQRERRPDGFDRCVNGHIYPSSKATPPKRPWVGLTDEEKHEYRYSHMTTADFIETIEAKLKEKNRG